MTISIDPYVNNKCPVATAKTERMKVDNIIEDVINSSKISINLSAYIEEVVTETIKAIIEDDMTYMILGPNKNNKDSVTYTANTYPGNENIRIHFASILLNIDFSLKDLLHYAIYQNSPSDSLDVNYNLSDIDEQIEIFTSYLDHFKATREKFMKLNPGAKNVNK